MASVEKRNEVRSPAHGSEVAPGVPNNSSNEAVCGKRAPASDSHDLHERNQSSGAPTSARGPDEHQSIPTSAKADTKADDVEIVDATNEHAEYNRSSSNCNTQDWFDDYPDQCISPDAKNLEADVASSAGNSIPRSTGNNQSTTERSPIVMSKVLEATSGQQVTAQADMSGFDANVPDDRQNGSRSHRRRERKTRRKSSHKQEGKTEMVLATLLAGAVLLLKALNMRAQLKEPTRGRY